MDRTKMIFKVRESKKRFISQGYAWEKKTASRNRFNEYTYLLKYIKEKDTLCKKSHLEEK